MTASILQWKKSTVGTLKGTVTRCKHQKEENGMEKKNVLTL